MNKLYKLLPLIIVSTCLIACERPSGSTNSGDFNIEIGYIETTSNTIDNFYNNISVSPYRSVIADMTYDGINAGERYYKEVCFYFYLENNVWIDTCPMGSEDYGLSTMSWQYICYNLERTLDEINHGSFSDDRWHAKYYINSSKGYCAIESQYSNSSDAIHFIFYFNEYGDNIHTIIFQANYVHNESQIIEYSTLIDIYYTYSTELD